jgi:hypothetical protein
MPRMIDSIRKNTLPSNMMQFAAKGALLVPPQEMIEILVYLANNNKVFGPQARLTLAGWDEASSRQAAADPQTPKEVLDYFIDHENMRPALLPVLLENPSVSERFLIRLAASASREQVEILLSSPRASVSKSVLDTLARCPSVTSATAEKIREKLSALAPGHANAPALVPAPVADAPNVSEARPPDLPDSAAPLSAPQEESSTDTPDETVDAFISKHAADIAAEAEKSFEPVSAMHEGLLPGSFESPQNAKAAAAAASTGTSEATAAVPQRAPQKKWVLSLEEQRGTALQKIAKLDTKGRIILAMKGNKEERSLLIRDGTKIVALAVLDSPKITDSEVERFASQKNVLEAVLREISMKRRFIKQYPVLRNLAFNPRTPIDVSLGLLKNLLIQDLRNLSGNKEVCETVRKLATKMFRQKLDVTKKS